MRLETKESIFSELVRIHLIQLMSLEFVADNRVVENVITSVLIFAITTLTIVATIGDTAIALIKIGTKRNHLFLA